MSLGRPEGTAATKRWRSRRRLSNDDRLDAELRDHIERHVADLVAAGITETEARN